MMMLMIDTKMDIVVMLIKMITNNLKVFHSQNRATIVKVSSALHGANNIDNIDADVEVFDMPNPY